MITAAERTHSTQLHVSMMQIASDIEKSLSHAQAEGKAKELYELGIKRVRDEVDYCLDNNRRLELHDIPAPVVVSLTNFVKDQKNHSGIELHRAFSKAYRVFLELTFYKSLNAEAMVSKEIKDTAIEQTCIMRKATSRAERATRFEYSCAKQAAKHLNLEEGFFSKHEDNILKTMQGLLRLSPGKFFGSAAKLLIDLYRDQGKRWYPDVYNLRWLSTKIQDDIEFQQRVPDNVIKEFQKEGGKYSLCLATICMDLLKSSNAEVKKRALACICELLSFDGTDLQERIRAVIIKKSFPSAKELVERADRYWPTRALILERTSELDPIEDAHSIEQIKDTLALRLKKPIALVEDETIRVALTGFAEAAIEANNERIAEVEDVLEPHRGDGNKNIDEKHAKELEEELKTRKLIKINLKQNIEVIKTSNFNSILQEMDGFLLNKTKP